jgi:hypothetical protein
VSNSNNRDVGWTVVTEAVYKTVEAIPDADSTDGSRYTVTAVPVSNADFAANSANPLYRTVTKTWAAGPDWEPWNS